MKHLLFILLFTISVSYMGAQVKYQNFHSSKLGEDRELKIQLPRGYDKDDKSYPLILVLDADYMFEAVAGNVDYFSYWEDMPASIVVGVNQLNKRYDDCMYSEQNSLPIDSGANFFEFLGLELIPHIEKTYRTGSFKAVIGHSESANFINYYLLKPQPLFQSYVAISPDLAPNMLEYLPEALRKVQRKTFYYLANTEKDTETIKSMTNALNTDISGVENDNLVYNFNNFKDPSHYSVPANAIPVALEKMFKIYQPISKMEYQEVILELEISPVLYLQEKYQEISDVLGIQKPILVNDFKAIAAAIERKEAYEYYEELGKMARESYPETLLGGYYIGRFYEETGEPKRAMRTYQSAYTLDEIAGITKDEVMDRADLIKADFGL
ncbi:alpha/beta hydrolase-fold protein [Tamlana sp. 2_MG-2023]|uniref:alpha/beta hydrolase n=1 Tax=unclassified Tamlana TaxID=2614803 RepID=UPI0026E1DFA5|nr:MULTISPECIES: alpha/beta hydrolase-fold protein [unclassified Tamlana]MDO6760504.1 alpha/beta hydrolase-fold protein [Tamlana sp. 2_MG-2023]MDO6790760.1 alpha/beta hydrolase-fold protein [Tamlana sp. 1_MG-2023]